MIRLQPEFDYEVQVTKDLNVVHNSNPIIPVLLKLISKMIIQSGRSFFAVFCVLLLNLFIVGSATAAITAAALTADAGSTLDGANYSTAAITPTTNNLILAWITNLVPDEGNRTMTVRLYHLTSCSANKALRHFCADINFTETLFHLSWYKSAKWFHRKIQALRRSELCLSFVL